MCAQAAIALSVATLKMTQLKILQSAKKDFAAVNSSISAGEGTEIENSPNLSQILQQNISGPNLWDVRVHFELTPFLDLSGYEQIVDFQSYLRPPSP